MGKIDLKKARRHVVLELHEAPVDSVQMSMMVHDEVSAYFHSCNPQWSGRKCLEAASAVVLGEIERYKAQVEDYGHMDKRWGDPRAYFVNVINTYRKLKELNQTDEHLSGVRNPVKTRWSL